MHHLLLFHCKSLKVSFLQLVESIFVRPITGEFEFGGDDSQVEEDLVGGMAEHVELVVFFHFEELFGVFQERVRVICQRELPVNQDHCRRTFEDQIDPSYFQLLLSVGDPFLCVEWPHLVLLTQSPHDLQHCVQHLQSVVVSLLELFSAVDGIGQIAPTINEFLNVGVEVNRLERGNFGVKILVQVDERGLIVLLFTDGPQKRGLYISVLMALDSNKIVLLYHSYEYLQGHTYPQSLSHLFGLLQKHPFSQNFIQLVRVLHDDRQRQSFEYQLAPLAHYSRQPLQSHCQHRPVLSQVYVSQQLTYYDIHLLRLHSYQILNNLIALIHLNYQFKRCPPLRTRLGSQSFLSSLNLLTLLGPSRPQVGELCTIDLQYFFIRQVQACHPEKQQSKSLKNLLECCPSHLNGESDQLDRRDQLHQGCNVSQQRRNYQQDLQASVCGIHVWNWAEALGP